MPQKPEFALHDVHIVPGETSLFDFDECYGGKRSHSQYYIEPYGPFEHNEMLDTFYLDAGNEMRYHEHERGAETFLVDGGSVQLEVCGQKCILTKGDIVHLPPYLPHKFIWLEEGTIWRELFQQMRMAEECIEGLRYKTYHKDDFDMAKDGQSTSSLYYEYKPVTVEVPKEQIYHVRPYDQGLETFQFPGVELRLKVGRWETKGHKEIWQLVAQPGFELSWSHRNPFYSLFVVQEGTVEVRIDGMEPFTAKERDILHVPPRLSGEVLAPEGAVLFDYNCEGFGLRAIEELASLAAFAPERLADEAEGVLEKHRVFLRGRLR